MAKKTSYTSTQNVQERYNPASTFNQVSKGIHDDFEALQSNIVGFNKVYNADFAAQPGWKQQIELLTLRIRGKDPARATKKTFDSLENRINSMDRVVQEFRENADTSRSEIDRLFDEEMRLRTYVEDKKKELDTVMGELGKAESFFERAKEHPEQAKSVNYLNIEKKYTEYKQKKNDIAVQITQASQEIDLISLNRKDEQQQLDACEQYHVIGLETRSLLVREYQSARRQFEMCVSNIRNAEIIHQSQKMLEAFVALKEDFKEASVKKAADLAQDHARLMPLMLPDKDSVERRGKYLEAATKSMETAKDAYVKQLAESNQAFDEAKLKLLPESAASGTQSSQKSKSLGDLVDEQNDKE